MSESITILGAVCQGVGGGKVPSEKLWSVYFKLLAYKELESNRIINEKTTVSCELNDEQLKMFQDKIKVNNIYKLEVAVKDNELELLNLDLKSIKKMDDSDLEMSIREYTKPIIYNDSVLGVMTYDKELEWYNATYSWLGEKGNVSVECESTQINGIINIVHNILEEKNNWLNKAKAFASEELTELANDWLEEDDENENTEITKRQFINNISFESLNIDEDGEFSIYFEDGDMFWGHVIIVCGNLYKGFDTAEIAG